ncbi:MAG: hypothetical protein U0175_14220 [Caldilineaceae bacterium]
MSNQPDLTDEPIEAAIYQIRVKGHLGLQWTEWFEGLAITSEENGDTLFIGTVTDQAALYGVLRKVRDLGMPLISLNRVVKEVS